MKRRFPAVALAVSACLAASAQAMDSTAVNTLNEVVVTGTNSAVGRNLIPYTVSVIGEHELESAGSTELLSVLSGRVPSMFVTQRGTLGFGVSSNGGAGHIKMRGVGGDRASAVLMMVDGQPQFAGIYSHHVADFYSKEYVEKVEVLRGPGSVLYGSNAMAGVINIITKDARKDGLHASLSSQYGSYNTWLTDASATARYGRFSSLVNVSYDRTDGNVKNFDFKQWEGYAKAGFDISDKWKAAADITLMNFKGNDPIYPTLSNPNSTDIYHQSIIRGETSLSATNRYGSTDGNVRVYYSWGNHFIDDPRHFHSIDDRFGVLTYQNFNPWQGAAVTLGFDFNTYTGQIPMSGGNEHKPGSMGTISKKSITEYSPYLTLGQSFANEQLILNGGVRMSNSDKFGTVWIPQAGFVLSPAKLFTFKFSASMGYRNPSFRELYLYRMANPDLTPEKMWNFEASIGKHFSHLLEVNLTAYYSRGSNIIQQVDMHNENTGRFYNKGIEVSANSRPLSNLSLSASYSYLHTSLSNLTGAPRNQYFLGVDWRIIKPLHVSAELKGIGDLYVADTVDDQSYALLNMKISYDFSTHFGLFCRLDNITDAKYVINRGYDMPGFTAMGGFKVNI